MSAGLIGLAAFVFGLLAIGFGFASGEASAKGDVTGENWGCGISLSLLVLALALVRLT